MVCPADCTPEEMVDQLSRFAVPGQNPAIPVLNNSINPVYDPILGEYMGRVVTTISEDGLTVTNTTLPGHIFYDGKIVRSVTWNDDGSWSVTTHGYGNNEIPGANHMNQTFGPDVFGIMDERMRENILQHHGWGS